jgi:hypothetical protein
METKFPLRIFTRLSTPTLLLLVLLAVMMATGADARSDGGAAANAGARGSEVSLPEYISALDHCSETLKAWPPDAASLKALRATLPAEWKVRADGDTYTVDTQWLRDALDGMMAGPVEQQQARWSATQQRVAALREAAEVLAVESAGGRLQQQQEQASRAKLEKILQAKEFQGAHGPSLWDQLLARVFGWIRKQLDKLHVPHSGAIGNTLAWLVIALAAVLVAVWAVRNFLRGRAAEMDLRGAASPGRGWRQWLREARAAAERGDYRAAIHAAYWGGVSCMEEANLLPEDRSRTPRESLRLVRKGSSEYAPLAALTRSFELVWYGYRAATESDWNAAREQLERLENARVPRPA